MHDSEINRADMPPDPFGPELELEPEQPAKGSPDAPALTPAQQAKANIMALERLRIEIAGRPLDAVAVVETVREQNAGRDWRSPEQDAREVLRRRQAVAASTNWSDLDRLAMVRAGVWIAHADGYGQGVTYAEVAALRRTGYPEGIAAAAREIVLRLSQIVAAPDADGLALARSDALSGIVARDEQQSAGV